MQNSRFWAQYDGVALGCVYAVVILVMALFDAAEPVQLIPRIYFGFAIGVLSKRMIDTAAIVLAETGTAGRVRVLMGIAQGTACGMAMILTFWPLEKAQVVIWACAGLVLALSWADWPNRCQCQRPAVRFIQCKTCRLVRLGFSLGQRFLWWSSPLRGCRTKRRATPCR